MFLLSIFIGVLCTCGIQVTMRCDAFVMIRELLTRSSIIVYMSLDIDVDSYPSRYKGKLSSTVRIGCY